MVPFDSRSPFLTSGIRIGTPAITTRGLKEEHIQGIVDLIDEVISNIDNEAVIKRVGDKVIEMMKVFPLFSM
jgi:glycine hydroxymethyltransferase